MRLRKFFISYSAKGKLLHRGVVLREREKSYSVALANTVTGLLDEKRNYPKTRTTHWQFFSTIEECNFQYEEYFRRHGWTR